MSTFRVVANLLPMACYICRILVSYLLFNKSGLNTERTAVLERLAFRVRSLSAALAKMTSFTGSKIEARNSKVEVLQLWLERVKLDEI